MHRSIDLYDPHADALERWPHWWFHFIPLDGITAKFSAQRQTFWLDADYWAGREDEAIATAIAHLDLGYHHTPGGLSVEQQEHGRFLSQVRLDREDNCDLV